ncbi:sporulation integral membrane protein YtvI [Salinibacillus xinjiangensis]|uniref:Sporulation integral membrane protein YtvI n=1 Tax=Salinibacillus xinjiangensis TaxID=1229268 RepID=A0A6G1X9I7_9BACI|nr:sporulation integral membrane protein YtvI [Salinibacillus xinjiangensis]MRG87681.1 sporulation integral membrane protein YtvI [Salinibacillus xinjiangensis]
MVHNIHIQRFIRFLIVIGIMAGVSILFIYLSKYTYPFIFALIFAFIMNPVVNYMEERLKFPRPLAVILVIFMTLAIIIGIITFLIVEIITGFTYLAKEVPKYFEELVTFFQELIAAQVIPIYERLSSMINNLDASYRAEIMDQISNIGSSVSETGQVILKNILTWIPNQIAGIPNLATVLIFSLLGTFFISKDWRKLSTMLKTTIPTYVVSSSNNVYKGLQNAFVGFIRAQFILISITAIIVLMGLLILQIEYAITLALIIGAIDLLPYLGTGLVFVPWILYMFFTGNYYLTIGLSILYAIVIIQRQLMEPKVLSSSIGLDPLATLIALFVGFQLLGFLGLIVGPVTLVILNTLYQAGVVREVWEYIKG